MCLDYVGVTTMERLDQGHHPLLEHPRQTFPVRGFEPTASCTAGEHSSKELLDQLMLLQYLCPVKYSTVECQAWSNIELYDMYSPGPEGTSCVNYWHTKLY